MFECKHCYCEIEKGEDHAHSCPYYGNEQSAASPTRELEDAAYRLAMLGLQSKRYSLDGEFSDAVDDVIHMTQREGMK